MLIHVTIMLLLQEKRRDFQQARRLPAPKRPVTRRFTDGSLTPTEAFFGRI